MIPNSVCPRCQDYTTDPHGIECTTCGYWPLREPTPIEAVDQDLRGHRIRVTAHDAKTAKRGRE